MKLILLRHGESEENKLELLQGLTPGKLTDLGSRQAELLGKWLKDEKLDIIYSSPIERCVQTTKIVGKYHKGTPIVYNSSIQERDFGRFTLRPRNKVDYNKLDEDSPENRAAGVETLDHVRERVKNFLSQIKRKHHDRTVLVVTHSNPLRMFLSELLNISFSDALKNYSLDNTSYSVFLINGGDQKAVYLDKADHLKKT